jgi:transposase
MATPLGLGKTTVWRDLRTTTWPERRRRCDRGHRVLTPDQPARLERWNAGGQDALRLGGEIQQQGDPGSYATVARYAQRVRQAQGQAPRPRRRRRPCPVVAEPHPRLLTARPAAWLVVPHEEQRTKDNAPQRAPRRVPHAAVAEAIDLAQDLVHLVRQRQPQPLAPWRARAAISAVGAWRRCATGLRDDDDALTAGVTLPWSRGPVAGPITRVTRLMRQMCGRASLARLERRFVLAPGRMRESVPHPQASSAMQAPPAAA